MLAFLSSKIVNILKELTLFINHCYKIIYNKIIMNTFNT